MKNPYSAPQMEDKMPCEISFTLKRLREMRAEVWQEGYEAKREEEIEQEARTQMSLL